MQKIDCKAMAEEIIEQVREIPNKHKALLILCAGDDPASASYMRGKMKDGERCGIKCIQDKCQTEEQLRNEILMANKTDKIGGIIVQLPLPAGWDESVVNLVDPAKDVDGFVAGSRFKPCTPEGIIHIMHKELGDLAGKTALIIGKGKLVGWPLKDMLLNEGVTVTVAHSRTRNLLREVGIYHDAVITAVGHPGLISANDANARLVVDAGISRGEDGKLHGDCSCNESGMFWDENIHITPVPGGVGLLTRAMLMRHMGEVQ